MIWLMEVSRIYLEEQSLIMYYMNNQKYDGYQRGLALMVQKVFYKNISGSAAESKIMPNQRPSDLANQQLAEELHKPITKTFVKRKVHSPFTENIWGADLADMQLISKFNKGICFLLCVIDVCSK